MMRCTISFLVGAFVSFSPLVWATPAKSFLDLDLKQNRYLGGVQNTSQISDYTFISGELNLETHTPGFNFKVDSMAQGAFEPGNEFYFGVPEVYAEPRMAPGTSLTIGRQRRHWSLLDEEFNLGMWQPQLRWDYLQPVQEGLIGMFFDTDITPYWHLTLFTSAVSIPDQGPQFELHNGQFSSGNRWFVQPQTRVEVSALSPGQEVPLDYELDRPSNESLVMHSSFGLSLRYDGQSPFWTQLSYAYLPRNQIHLGIDCPNCFNLNVDTITAEIHPEIVKHQIMTWEAGFNRYADHGWISVSGDIPNSSSFPSTYQQSPLDSMLVTGFAYEHYAFAWLGIPSWLKASYMRVFEYKGRASAGFVDGVQSSLDRYPFTEVAAVEWRALLSKVKHRWQFKTRYTYSIPERGGWLSSSVDWIMGPVTWNLGFDILGANVDPNSSSAGLFSRYRSNDRVFGGISYVF